MVHGYTVAATTAHELRSAVNTRRHIRGRRCWRALLSSPPAPAETWKRPNRRSDQVPCWRVPIRQRKLLAVRPFAQFRILSPLGTHSSAPSREVHTHLRLQPQPRSK